jgi:hypothetical protein
MSSTVQIVLNREREMQLDMIKRKVGHLRNLGTSDAINRLIFDAMDKIVPLGSAKAATSGNASKENK